MKHTTPEQARCTADLLEQVPRLYTGAACNALRSLAEQLEAVTEKRDNALQSAKYTADLCTQALADPKAVTAERDAYKLRYDFIRAGNVYIELSDGEFYAVIGDGRGKYYKDMRDFDADIINAAIAKEAK